MLELPENASLQAYQHYIHQLEALHGWLDLDLIHNCFLMGEEMGELFKAVRTYTRYYAEAGPEKPTGTEPVAEEIVDVFNYLLALANRLDIDLEAAFRAKNLKNQQRTWHPPSAPTRISML